MSTRHRNRILLVEDEPIIAMSEKLTLEKHGYSVTVSHSGEEAIEAFRTHDAIDLVLMDIELGSGTEKRYSEAGGNVFFAD